jgi:S1-C subfamily serine protease
VRSPIVAALAVGVLIVLLVGVAIGVLAERRGEPPIATGPTYDEAAVTSLFEAAAPSVVELIVHRADGSTDTGAGFFVDSDGHVVTNSHVVDGAMSVDVSLADGRILDGTLLGSSPSDDLALIAVDAGQVTDIEPLKLADSSALKSGQLAIAIGSPFRMQNFLSVGIVAGVGDSPALLRDRRAAPALQRPIPNMVWTDAALLPGNSGGPLLNSNGEVIGVTSAVQISAQGDFGIGFAVPSNILAGLMPRLMESELVSRPWLGIRGTSITPDISAALGISAESGVYIREVIPNTGASDARLRDDPFQSASGRGDVIVAVDGRKINSVSEMVDYFNTLLPGDDVTLTVLRDGAERTIAVTLGGWPAPGN